jgi:hypothetical protein
MIRTSIDSLRDRWENLHPLLRFLLLALAVAGLGWVAAKPAYLAFKSWRVDRNLIAARKAITEVRMDDARDLSMTVLQTGDPRIEAFQILEKSTAALRDPRHGEIARSLMSHPQSTDEDRLTGFRGLAPEAALGLLGQAWATLPAGCQQDSRFAAVFAQRLIAGQRLSEAASVLLAVPEPTRSNAVHTLLIRILISSGKPAGYDEAQRLIAAQMPADPTHPDAWLDLLEDIPTPNLRERLLDPVRKLLAHPVDGFEGRMALMLARMDYAANPSQAAAVLDKAVDRWRERDPKALADFLGKLGLYQRLLETFAAAQLEAHPEVLPRMLEAMERSGAWDQVLPLLDAHGHHWPKFEELGHRAMAAIKTADASSRVAAWNAAMAEAGASPAATAYLTLHQLTRDAGLDDEAEQAMVAAIRMGRGPLPLYAELKPLLSSLAQQGRDKTLLEICASYLALEPGNPVLLTQFAYLSCLNNAIEPKTLLKAMEILATGFPKDLTIQCVLATAYLCDGQQPKAAETLDRLELNPSQLAPTYRVVYLTTQVLNHRIAKDDPRISDFPWKSLLPSERKKFNELLRSAKP